jgi:Fe-S cluster assembly protein SufD
VGEGAHLDHDLMQAAGDRAAHVATTLVRIGKDATYDGFAFTLGAELSRAEVHAVLEGPGGDCRVDGAYLGRGGQHIDNTTLIEHASPHGRSRQVFKGVLDERARGVFQGKIVVRRGAQKTDGHQLSRALLLSEAAEIDAKPELEIYADDVKCSHGATAGEIDAEALFYLRSRGIDEDAARGLLVRAFLAEAIEAIPVEPVREEFIEAVAAWLEARAAKGGEA